VNDEPSTHASEVTKPGAGATACPVCKTVRPAGDRFCETCGHDLSTPTNGADGAVRFATHTLTPPSPVTTWSLAK